MAGFPDPVLTVDPLLSRGQALRTPGHTPKEIGGRREEFLMSSTSLADLPIFERADERYRRLPSCLKSQRIWYPSKFIPRPNGRLGKPPCNRQGKLATQWQYKSNWMSFD